MNKILKDWAVLCLRDVLQMNPEKVALGLKEDNVFEVFKAPLTQAKEKFFSHPQLKELNISFQEAEDHFNLALNDSLFSSHSFVNCNLW